MTAAILQSAGSPLQLLRRLLLADAIISVVSGVVLALAAGPLADQFGLPVTLLRVAGLVLLPFAVAVLYFASREQLSRRVGWGVVGLNLLWALGSLLLLVTGWVEPTGIGYLFVIVQALIVVVLTDLQVMGLRRTP